MKTAVFSARSYDRLFLEEANQSGSQEFVFHTHRLTTSTVDLAAGAAAVCVFVNDVVDASVLASLTAMGVRLVALRCAGSNQVDLPTAHRLGITVCRVPTYSPEAVAEHAMGLILALNRKIHRAHNRIHEGNFALDGLIGFNLAGKTVGIVGTGGIGTAMARILLGFRCTVIATDPVLNPDLIAEGVRYVTRDALFGTSDIVTLHCPLNASTRHLVDGAILARSRRGFMLVNTGRGSLVDTGAAIDALKSGQLGNFALDVYEGEEGLFFEDHSGQILQDDIFARLLTFPNVLITGHQAFFTAEAMTAIAATTIANLETFEQSGKPRHPL